LALSLTYAYLGIHERVGRLPDRCSVLQNSGDVNNIKYCAASSYSQTACARRRKLVRPSADLVAEGGQTRKAVDDAGAGVVGPAEEIPNEVAIQAFEVR
jgi:hypothetical protein